jgi:hypothetical protein
VDQRVSIRLRNAASGRRPLPASLVAHNFLVAHVVLQSPKARGFRAGRKSNQLDGRWPTTSGTGAIDFDYVTGMSPPLRSDDRSSVAKLHAGNSNSHVCRFPPRSERGGTTSVLW